MHALWLCVFVSTWAFAAPLLAQAAPLSVSRGPGADDCPDAAGLLARIEDVRKTPVRGDQPHYLVVFARDAAGLHAEIVHEPSETSRVLNDGSPDCTALARATAVTLALLFDADARALEEIAAPQPSPPDPPLPPAAPPRVEDTAPEPTPWSIAIGGGLAFEVVGPVAPALAIEGSFINRRWRGALGIAVLAESAIQLEPGTVRQGLGAATLSTCWAPWLDGRWRFDSCVGGWLGAIHGGARGFDENGGAWRVWPALSLDLRLGWLPDAATSVGAELVTTLLVPIYRQDFAVENVGVAHEASPLALEVTLRLIAL